MYMKFNRKYKTKALTNGNTDPLELPEAGIVSGIHLDFSAVNASAVQNANKARIIDHITKIEITDGGTDTIFSLLGQQLKALDFYSLGNVMPESAILYGNKTQRTSVVIPFGDYLGDPKHAFDLNSFDQANLEITNDATTSNWAAGALNVDVQLITLEDLVVKPAGYYKHYQWKSEKPSAAAQYVYHSLPTKDKIRRVIAQLDPDIATAGSATTDPITDSNTIKFSLKEYGELVWDHRPKDIMRANSALYGLVETQGRYFASASQYADMAVGYVTNVQAGWCTDATPANTDYLEMAESNSRFQVAAGVAGVNFMDARAIGIGYYHTMCLYDSMNGDEMAFLDPGSSGKGPVKIDYYNNGADHTCRTILTVPKKQGEA